MSGDQLKQAHHSKNAAHTSWDSVELVLFVPLHKANFVFSTFIEKYNAASLHENQSTEGLF